MCARVIWHKFIVPQAPWCAMHFVSLFFVCHTQLASVCFFEDNLGRRFNRIYPSIPPASSLLSYSASPFISPNSVRKLLSLFCAVVAEYVTVMNCALVCLCVLLLLLLILFVDYATHHKLYCCVCAPVVVCATLLCASALFSRSLYVVKSPPSFLGDQFVPSP